MSSLQISVITLACLVAGIGLGIGLQYLLPGHHLSPDSKDTVKLGSGMVATMSALILGLLVSSSKSSFDLVNVSIAENGARMIEMDHLLGEYGPETKALRDHLKQGLAERIEKIWSTGNHGPSGLRSVEKSTAMQDLQKQLSDLNPTNDFQRLIIAQARQASSAVWESRLMIIEKQQTGLPAPMLVLMVFWLTLLFVSFGLFAPRNLTVFGILFVCAVSVSSAIFLVLEMSHPLDGMIKASSAPLLKALELMGN